MCSALLFGSGGPVARFVPAGALAETPFSQRILKIFLFGRKISKGLKNGLELLCSIRFLGAKIRFTKSGLYCDGLDPLDSKLLADGCLPILALVFSFHHFALFAVIFVK